MKLVLLVVCVTAIATADWCPQGPARSDAEVDAIVKNMTSASFSSDQLKALSKGLTEGMDHNLPLRSQSMVALLQPLSFSADKATALQLMLRGSSSCSVLHISARKMARPRYIAA